MQAAGQPHQKPHQGPTEQSPQHGTDGTGVGDGVIDVQPHIGAEQAEAGEDDVYQHLVRESDRIVGQRA
ncbi:hypothetical protein D3C85_1816140 [compost metagenome]